MTLGPALIVLALFERAGEPGRLLRPVLVFGRVPLFYYLLHIPLIHLLALGYSNARFGGPTGVLTMEPFVAAMTGNSVYPRSMASVCRLFTPCGRQWCCCSIGPAAGLRNGSGAAVTRG